MIHAILIEDEKPAARRLHRMLTALHVDVKTMLHSVAEAVDYLSKNPAPDLIFLDIQLSDGLSFEIFEKVEVRSAIIFTTAYDEYALQAFKLNSIDYLLKPIDNEELKNAVEKFESRFRESEPIKQTIDFNEIAKLLSNPVGREYKKRYTAKVGEHIKLFSTDEICLFFSENKGAYLQLENGRSYLLDTNLEELEKELDPAVFYRISRQAIVNINAIKDMVSYVNSRIIVKVDNFKNYDLIVSRERVKDFKNWLES